MQTKLTGLHLFAGKLSLFALHFVGAEQSPAPTERIPKAPLAGELSAKQTERLSQIRLNLSVSAAPSQHPYPFCPFGTFPPDRGNRPLGGEPFCGGMEPRGILRRLRRLRADWIFFLILRKAQNCGVDTPRNPVGRTQGFLAPLSAAMQKRHPKWDGVFAWWS